MYKFIILFAVTYVTSTIIKFLWYRHKINQGYVLISKLQKTYSNRVLANELYPFIVEYCKPVNKTAYIDPYGVPMQLINKTSSLFITQVQSSLHEVIGIYKFRKRYSYILLPISGKDTKRIFLVLLDILCKSTLTVLADVLVEYIRELCL